MTRLTEEQVEAVARRSEPLLLSAAAGSGKTSVLVERFVAAVREDEIAPGKILAITFTERAAGELRSRVRARLLELGDRDAARDTEAAYVGTFHGFCARLLRAHPLAVGLDPQFAILEEGLAGRLREQAFKAGSARFPRGRARAMRWICVAAYGVDRVYAMVEQVYRELRSRGQRFPRLPSSRLDADPEAQAPTEERAQTDAAALATCALLDELLQAYGSAYEQLKRGRAAVDFDDLELLARAAAERARWGARRVVGSLRARDGGRVPGHERAPAGHPRGAAARQPVHGRGRAAVDLRVQARGRQPVSGAAGGAHERGGSLQLTRNFRSREPAAGRGQRGLRRALRDVRAAGRRTRGRRARTATEGRAAADEREGLGGARGSRRADRRGPAARATVAPGGGAAAGSARGGARGERAGTGGRGGGAAACIGRPGGVRARPAAAGPAYAGGGRRVLGAPADRRSDLLPESAREPARRGGAVLGAGLAAGGLLEGLPGAARGRGAKRAHGRLGGRRGRRAAEQEGSIELAASDERGARRLLRAAAGGARERVAADHLPADRARDRGERLPRARAGARLG